MAETLFYHQVNAYIIWLVIASLFIYGLQLIYISFISFFMNIRRKILRSYYRDSSNGYETQEDLVYDN
jgi:hypothetical protein|tara:strand:+ start:48 stop:251 length:204 start_codon:yes stop_codon:yes gene_type:complete